MRIDFDCQHQFPGGFQIDVNLALKNRCSVLFGPSGSGKTSVLSMIAGILRPQHGRITATDPSETTSVFFDSAQEIWTAPEKRNIGYVLQDSLLFPHLDVRNNLQFGVRHRVGSNSETDELDDVIEVFQLRTLLDRMPHSLSGGEKQRVALGRALASQPQLLLMDEPLASLDETLKKEVIEFLKQSIATWDIPVIYVTHSSAEAKIFGEQIVYLADGRITNQTSDQLG